MSQTMHGFCDNASQNKRHTLLQETVRQFDFGHAPNKKFLPACCPKLQLFECSTQIKGLRMPAPF